MTTDKKDKPKKKSDIETDKFILDLMIMAYESEDKRNDLIDNKSSNLIAFLGAILTVQATFGAGIIQSLSKDNLELFIMICIFYALSLIFYGAALFSLINSYNIKDFKSAPSPEVLHEYKLNFDSQRKIAREVSGNMKNSILNNKKVISDKVCYVKYGFNFIKGAVIFTIIFILLMLIIII